MAFFQKNMTDETALKIDAIGAGISAGGSVLGALSRSSGLEFQSALSSINARLVDLQADQIMRSAGLQAAQVGLQAGQTMGTARAVHGASGIQAGVGSAAEAIASTDLMKEIDLLTINSNAVQSMNQARLSKFSLNAQSALQSSAAAGINPVSAGVSSLLGSASRLSTRWSNMQRGYPGGGKA